jgi:acetylornithine deacetylase/succinyl-diaminopimelate desuccinylase-like protein
MTIKSHLKQLHHTLNWSTLPTLADWVVASAIAIQQIPAPTFAEAQRAQYVAEQFRVLGLQEVTLDALHNVYGRLPGAQPTERGLMFVAHTDTVFAAETNLAIRREADLIYGPGLGDNSLGVAALLGLAKYLRDENIVPACDVWFVATVCEEGLGDLKGIRAAYTTLQERIGGVLNLEGLAYGHIYHAGIAVHRLHITATAEGGHSWLHFGRASAVHGIVELGAQICRIVPPSSPRTTYNIGMVEGGQGINAIGTQAGLWLDLRSEQQGELDKLRHQVLNLLQQLQTNELRFQAHVVGERPAGYLSARHAFVQGALAALELENVRGALETGSTDANVPLAAGCPAVTIGITRGGNAHRLDEYIETKPIPAGMRQWITLALATAQHQAAHNPVAK